MKFENAILTILILTLFLPNVAFLHIDGYAVSNSHYYSNAHYYSGQAYRQAFGLYTFSYLAKDELFLLRCPTYQRSLCFEIEKVKLVFKSPKPLYGRCDIKKVVQWFVNLNRYTMEFYEENLCWLIPCYKIIYELRRS